MYVVRMDLRNAYIQLRDYCDDLVERIDLYEEWKGRHPDNDTEQFYRDEQEFYDDKKISGFLSSFNPDDPQPSIADVLSAQTFASLMMLSLDNNERINRLEARMDH